MESRKSEPIVRNRLVELEGGDFFVGLMYDMPEGMSENRKQRMICKSNILHNIYNHYVEEWAKQEGKTDALSDEEVSEMNKYISSIPPDQICSLLESWAKDWGASRYKELDEEDKIAIDAVTDLMREIDTW